MRWIILLAGLIVINTGCTINNSIILKTDRDFVFDSLPEQAYLVDYKLSPNDRISFRLFANEGFAMIDIANSTTGGATSAVRLNANTGFDFVIETDSAVNLPIIGRVKVAGLTLKEAELMLEERYSTFYNRPFATLTISNRRVVVFPGEAGDAKVISLSNNNTTLLEVLAAAGGIRERGRANRIRLIRVEKGERKVYNIDLSTMDGLDKIDIVMQANDVVYVEPAPEIARELLKDLTPVITLITSSVTVWLVITRGL